MGVRRVVVVLCCLLVGFAPAPLPRPSPAREELAKLQGSWVRVRLGSEGQTRKDDVEMTIVGDRMMYGSRVNGYRIYLSPTRRPRVLDRRDYDGRSAYTDWGIYQLEGDVLVICSRTTKSSADRPTDLSGRENGVLIEVFHRRPPKPPRPAR
jgi:uncharacterized protein (TIGR03067 family)